MTEHEQLIQNLKYLKLNEIISHLNDTVDFIMINNLSFEHGLIKSTNYEINHKESKLIKAMVKMGAFRHHFDFQENINKTQIMDFLSHRFIYEKENIIFLGSNGVEKTHLATSIGISVAKKRMSTYFIKCYDLITQLKKEN